MPVEMIGWIAPQVSSEIVRPQGPVFDPAVIAETARIHEEADFDRVLIGYFSNAPDGFLIGAHAAAHTSRLAFLLAHRPGFVAPTVAARKMATLDQLTGGRLAVHLISGGNDEDQARDGDFTDHAARYRRTSEYVEIMRADLDRAVGVRPRRRVLPGAAAAVDHPLRPGAPHPDLRGRRVGGGRGRPGPPREHLHAVGRAAGRDGGVHGPGAGRRRTGPPG